MPLHFKGLVGTRYFGFGHLTTLIVKLKLLKVVLQYPEASSVPVLPVVLDGITDSVIQIHGIS